MFVAKVTDSLVATQKVDAMVVVGNNNQYVSENYRERARLLFHNGERIAGKYLSTVGRRAKIDTPYLAQPVAFSLEGASQLTFIYSKTPAKQNPTRHFL